MYFKFLLDTHINKVTKKNIYLFIQTHQWLADGLNII